jgi:hypothetical protein
MRSIGSRENSSAELATRSSQSIATVCAKPRRNSHFVGRPYTHVRSPMVVVTRPPGASAVHFFLCFCSKCASRARSSPARGPVAPSPPRRSSSICATMNSPRGSPCSVSQSAYTSRGSSSSGASRTARKSAAPSRSSGRALAALGVRSVRMRHHTTAGASYCCQAKIALSA